MEAVKCIHSKKYFADVDRFLGVTTKIYRYFLYLLKYRLSHIKQQHSSNMF